ncbi:MAG TPA: hypothetical protein PKY78_02620 [Candidatus Omnitrophota bacterium]|nr:hypothetical protein [Candidatus Omnitrophota bacterium]
MRIPLLILVGMGIIMCHGSVSCVAVDDARVENSLKEVNESRYEKVRKHLEDFPDRSKPWISGVYTTDGKGKTGERN